MKIEEIDNLIKDIESAIETKKFSLFGIDVWPYLRIRLVNQLRYVVNDYKIRNSYSKRIKKKLKILLKGLFDLIKLYITDNSKNDSYNYQRDFLFLTSSHSKRIKFKEGWYDQYIDPLIDIYESFGKSYIILESSQKLTFRYPRYRKTKLIFIDMLLIYINSIILFPFGKIENNFHDAYQQYENILSKKGLKKHAIDRNSLVLEFLFIHQLSKYFIRKLKIINPKMVFVVSYYGFTGMAMCHACCKLNIKCVDIQHGAQGNYHPAYGSFLKIPLYGYNVMPELFFNWSKEDASSINSWAKKTKKLKAYPVGNLCQKVFQDKNHITEYFDAKFNNKFYEILSKKKILITLQNQLLIPKLFIDLIDLSPKNFFYFIRYHPGSSDMEKRIIKKKLEKCHNQNYEFDLTTRFPLYALLRNMDIHITQYSSVVIEAADFKIKSIITNKLGKYYYKSYIDNKDTFYCDRLSKLLNLIKILIDERNNKNLLKVNNRKDENYCLSLLKLTEKILQNE